MHPQPKALVYTGCGHLTFKPRQVLLFTFSVDMTIHPGGRQRN